jgi:glucose-6-phosphate isomerase
MTNPGLFADTKYSFLKSKAYKKLEHLAKHPPSLKDPDFVTPERLGEYVAEGCGYRLLYGLQRVDGEVMAALEELAEEARLLEKMEAMQSGQVINFIEGYESEQRAVLHTAMRDFFDDPQTAAPAREAAELAREQVDRLESFLGELGDFTDMIFVGIGGSELGPKMLYYGLQGYAKERRVHFVSNVDPDDVAQAVRGCDLTKTLVLSVSKSGGTLETKTNEDLVRSFYEKAGLNANDYVVAITGKGSPMDDPDRYRACFYIWDYVGGRYCGTSMVGGVMLSFAYGIDVYRELLRGANAMDKLAREEELEKNLPMLMALLGIWNRNFLGYPTVALIPYSQMLVRFAAHVQQCDMESNGKHIDRHGVRVAFETGPIIWGEPATNAQHSFFQLIHQGTDVIPLEFVGYRENQCGVDLDVQGTSSREKLVANLFAQALALSLGQENPNPNKSFEGDRPCSILLGERLDPFALGALLSLYEHKVVFQGFCWHINSFDQEGVQLGKVLANKILDRIASRRSGTGGEPYPLGDALLDML